MDGQVDRVRVVPHEVLREDGAVRQALLKLLGHGPGMVARRALGPAPGAVDVCVDLPEGLLLWSLNLRVQGQP